MSHFAVLVVGPDPVAQLAPFHEFECTGRDDEYVIDVDVTERALKKYAEDTTTRIKLPDGTLESFFDEKGEWRQEFSQQEEDPTFKSMSRRTYYVPPGHEKVEVLTSTLKSFEEFCKDYGGWRVDADGRAWDHTNPNAKWDWYQLGGRWTGFFKLKPGCMGLLGEPSLLARDHKMDSTTADSALKGNIDFQAMRAKDEQQARQAWHKVHDPLNGVRWAAWEEVLKEFGTERIDEARKFYHGQVAFELSPHLGKHIFDRDSFLVTEEEYANRATAGSGATFAVLMNGQWYERGKMGWWGIVSDDSGDEWFAKFHELVDSLPDDTMLTIVDCHI